MSRYPFVRPLFLMVLPLVFAGCPAEPEPSCTDEILNGDETDLDCGGSCGPCDVLESCIEGDDCVEGVCEADTCVAASCDDGVMNGAEVAVDCGDSCVCDIGQPCTDGSDCVDGVCEEGTCQAAACDDAVLNGDETDEDCGGSCEPCVRGEACLETADCLETVCMESVCERALVISGTTNKVDALIGVYVKQSLVRVDFAAPPTVHDFDGSEILLPVSKKRAFVSSVLSDPLKSSEVTVDGVAMTSATGETTYQSIEPAYFGVIVRFDSEASATAGFEALEAPGIDNKPLEIVVIDRTP